ncbi:MAG: hypothetical protein LBD37_03575 [Treponema sp.]|jgi:hypothetical protein|nr:hypothetical protein [Treponema sp.]
MKKWIAGALFFSAAVFSYAQTRDDVRIYIPMPRGGTPDEEAFFKENFTMETTAAGYAVTEEQRKSDYTLNLEIKPNMIVYEDGTEEQAPEDEKQQLLELKLVRNEDGNEIVSFSFAFTEKEEMYEYNLFLLYQAMANVPLTKITAVPDTDHWRNKWIYTRLSVDASLSIFHMDQNQENIEYNLKENRWDPIKDPSHGQEVIFSPSGTIGVELQFLNWMAAEAVFKPLFGLPDAQTFVPVVGLQLKGVLKPSKHFMIEPYLALDFQLATADTVKAYTPLALGGGVQLGVKGGERGAFFVDVWFDISIGEIHTAKPNSRDLYWNHYVMGVGIGYKVGFYNRNKEAPPEE